VKTQNIGTNPVCYDVILAMCGQDVLNCRFKIVSGCSLSVFVCVTHCFILCIATVLSLVHGDYLHVREKIEHAQKNPLLKVTNGYKFALWFQISFSAF